MVDLSVVAEMREHALEESWALRTEVRLQVLADHEPSSAWLEDAPCRGMDPDVFHPDERPGRALYDRAREVCRGCPVRLSCLAEFLDEDDGCYAGTSPKERRRIRKALSDRGLVMRHVSVEHRYQVAKKTRRAA